MKKVSPSFKVLFFIIPLSFIIGLSWGIDYKKNKLSQVKNEPKKPMLYVSAPRYLITQDLVNLFTEQTGIQVEVSFLNEDAEHLQSIIKDRDKLDVVLIHNQMIPILQKLKLTKAHKIKNIREHISADFLNLNFDPKNNYYIPFAWNFYEVAYNKNSYKESQIQLADLLNNKKNKRLIDYNFYETYFLLKKTGLISDEWIKTQRQDLVESALQRLLATAEFNKPANLNILSQNYDWIFTAHVKAQKILENNKDWQSQIPVEKSNINLLLWTKLSRNKNINKWIDFIHKNHEIILKNKDYASVYKNSMLPSYQQSSYIRKRSLLRLEMQISPHIMEGIWSQSYKKVMPESKTSKSANFANH